MSYMTQVVVVIVLGGGVQYKNVLLLQPVQKCHALLLCPFVQIITLFFVMIGECQGIIIGSNTI